VSLQLGPVPPVPDETARVARAAFPKGHPFMRMRDEFGAIYEDAAFARLFPARGQPAAAPWRLALVTIFQFAENLSDRQAADAVRGRIDWKYALSLELTDPGFDASVLSEFRTRLLAGGEEGLLLDALLERFRQRGLLKARGRQRTDSTHVLAAVRALNRLELVTETMRHALEILSAVAPAWLRTHAAAEWVARYGRRAEEGRLPTKKEERQELAATIGADGTALLTAAYASDAPQWLREVPAVETLRRVWVQNYRQDEEGVQWRDDDDIPPSSLFISSPYDPDAHLGKKGGTYWVGYKVSLTETCEDDVPNLITHAETTAGPVADGEVTPVVHRDLRADDLLPAIHLVDTGFLDAELIATSKRDYGVELLGPTRPDVKWQAKEGTGFEAQRFAIDWGREQATCPKGKTSISWTPAVDKRTNRVIKIKFSTTDCRNCASRDLCIRSRKTYARRAITIRPKEQYEALKARRAYEQTPDYAAAYAKRAGIEGTISQGVRRCGLRRSRYLGLAKTHLGHVLTAAAIDFVRVADWLADIPRARTRRSTFATLMAQPVLG
jgi:transposase